MHQGMLLCSKSWLHGWLGRFLSPAAGGGRDEQDACDLNGAYCIFNSVHTRTSYPAAAVAATVPRPPGGGGGWGGLRAICHTSHGHDMVS